MPRKQSSIDHYLPGDKTPKQRLEQIIRVNHAGEYGAKRIYAGQLAVLKNSSSAALIKHMAEQEEKHLKYFERQMGERHVRPTILFPLWHVGGFLLGAATALLGEKAAMACTEAVEEVIDEHYSGQLAELSGHEPDLCAAITEFRAEEQEHRDTATAHDAKSAPAYPLLSETIKTTSRLAIWLATRF